MRRLESFLFAAVFAALAIVCGAIADNNPGLTKVAYAVLGMGCMAYCMYYMHRMARVTDNKGVHRE